MDLIEVKLADLVEHPSNVRRDVGDVSELAESISAQGLLEPLIVAPHGGKSSRYVIVAGHRRVAAAREAKLRKLPAVVRADLESEAAQLEAMLVENLQRTDLTPVEEAKAYEQLLAFDYDVKRIAKATGRSRATVKSRLALTKLGSEEQERVHEGQISLAQAEVLAEFSGDKQATKRLVAAVGTYNWDFEVQQQRRLRDGKKRAVKTRKGLESAGIPILDKPPAYNEKAERLPQLVDAATGQPVEVADHVSCPGHAAYLDMDGEAEYVCTDPQKNGHIDRWKYSNERDRAIARRYDPETGAAAELHSAEADEDYAAEESARTQLLEDLETAAQVRQEFIAQLVRRPSPPAGAGGLVLYATIEWVTTDLDDDLANGLQALGVPVAADADSDEWEKAARDAARALTDAQALQLLLWSALNALETNVSWTNPHASFEQGVVSRWRTHSAYFEFLENAGYTFSDVERRILDQFDTEEDDSEPVEAAVAS